jgi:hypothetical protein
VAEIHDLNTTDASNTGRFPENMAPSAVNNGARALEGLIARFYQDLVTAPVATLSGSAIQFTSSRTSLTLTGTTSNYAANTLIGWTMGGNPNTGPASLKVNNIGAISLRDNQGASLTSSQIMAGARCLAVKDGTNNYFRLLFGGRVGITNLIDGTADIVNDLTPQLGGFLATNSKFVSFSQGANIASVAGDTNIWAFDGNTVHITGTNAITDFGTPKQAGDFMWVIFDAAASVVDSATITVDGNTNFQAAANDVALVYALSTSTFLFKPMKNDGTATVSAGSAPTTTTFTSSGTYTKPSGLTAALVFTTGAGGGGGGGADGAGGGSGGAGGGSAIEMLAAGDIGSTETVTIGAAGSAGASGGAGGAGGTSSFGSLNSATGGAAGLAGVASGASSGQGGVGSGGDLNLRGDDGGKESGGNAFHGGHGGSSFWAGGGRPAGGGSSGTEPGQVGTHGSGAGGGYGGGTIANRAGGAGGAGTVFVINFF